MSDWYTTRERFKEAVGIHGSDRDALIDRKIAAASRTIDEQMNRRFIPILATRYFPWPQRTQDSKQILWLDEDLISVDTDGLKTANGTITIAVTDFFLEPVNEGPPYRTIEIDLGDNVAADAAFGSDDSAQRAISVQGQWGYGNDTEAAGTVALVTITSSSVANPSVITTATAHGLTTGDIIVIAGHTGSVPDINGSHTATVTGATTFTIPINVTTGGTGGTVTSGFATNTSVTTLVCSDGSLIDVGHTLLIESEQLFVTGRATVDTTCNTVGALTTEQSEVSVTVTDGTKVKAGEVVLINSEKFYVVDVTGNVLTVKRAWDASVLAAHNDAQDVYAFRTLTVVRGVNGTTADKHADATAISRYAPPEPIQSLCLAEAIFNYEQDKAGHTGMVGDAEMAMRVNPNPLAFAWRRAMSYREPVIA